MMDDFRLMIEKNVMQSTIINRRSKMLSSFIQTRQEMLANLAPVCVLRTCRRKVWDMPEDKAPSSSVEQSDAAGKEIGR